MPNPTALDAPAARRRFRPALVPTLATIAAVTLFAAAGNWQHRRMIEKESLRARFDAAQAAPPLDLASLPGQVDWDALRYRPIVAEGEYLAQAQILVDNKVHDGRAGYHVVTPLALVDGRRVLVDRGWIPLGATRAHPPPAPPPAVAVRVHGRVAPPAANFVALAPDKPEGIVWQHVDPQHFAAASGIAVLPIIIEATPLAVREGEPMPDWHAPDFGIDKHRIYMVQWYAFAALALVLWIVLNVQRGKRADG